MKKDLGRIINLLNSPTNCHKKKTQEFNVVNKGICALQKTFLASEFIFRNVICWFCKMATKNSY